MLISTHLVTCKVVSELNLRIALDAGKCPGSDCTRTAHRNLPPQANHVSTLKRHQNTLLAFGVEFANVSADWQIASPHQSCFTRDHLNLLDLCRHIDVISRNLNVFHSCLPSPKVCCSGGMITGQKRSKAQDLGRRVTKLTF